MINAHNEAKNDDTEYDQEFHDVHGGTERKGISVFVIGTSVVRSVRPRFVGLEEFWREEIWVIYLSFGGCGIYETSRFNGVRYWNITRG